VTEDWFRAAFGAHYPLLYAHRDETEARRCLDLLPALAPVDGPVLDLGCGDGRHLEYLHDQGAEVVGLDLSAHLLEAARQRSASPGSLRLVQGDMRRISFAEATFGSVLSLFTAFGYFGSPTANQQPINEISRVLKTGGRWFLDYFDGDRVRAELGDGRPLERKRTLGPLEVTEVRRLVQKDSVVTKLVSLRACPGLEEQAAAVGIPAEGLSYTEQVAVFTLQELDSMSLSAHMTRVAGAGGYEGQELGSGPRWILVYEKMKNGGDRDL